MDLIRLYHGSKNGIKGEINVRASITECDFGQGFYTGDKPDQPKGLIANWPHNEFYEIDCNLENLSVKRFGNEYKDMIDWTLYIAYNRGKIDTQRYEKIAKKYEEYNSKYDVIIGLIANDKMYKILEDFFDLNICDKAVLDALTRVKLGNQYVFKTQRSCTEEHLKIVSSKTLDYSEIKMAKVQENNRRQQTSDIVQQLKTRYRHAGNVKYFDEILEEWNETETDS